VTTTTETVYLTGNTYPYRDDLRRAGLKWDAAGKVWVGTREQAEKVTERFANHRIVTMTAMPTKATPAASRGPCRRCGTYCYGDCSAH